ncbi:tyrosyl-DNA phosphodiesterase-domain-containing protein [Mucor mucedo]|uniref:tyrosyl-DNA phosphodiesterase-domain-containing protein n=1 Tax=Mucor mucedo TaxID=29922 RepID=UPI00221FECE9|nr:tyrosyl-DNA phosphodiesterase-domain-containing protein [Mucor mucedo]KAI7897075.1 tyrosyl-DNA phosphodiesterase-domain-containing protein [Mucor mucedo]
MSDTEEQEQIARAIALSLSGLESRLTEEERETQDLKEAVAASLGKSVDSLTARDMLTAGSVSYKRPREQEPIVAEQRKVVVRRFDYSNQQFWDGVVKLTYVKGFVGQTFIRFEDIVQKTKLKKALVTAFVCSMDFIEDNFPANVNVCIVTHGRPATKAQLSQYRTIIRPHLKDEKFGVFHPKMMLLFYEAHMRVVIGSANMERYDYEDLENVVFIQDFPKRRNDQPAIRTTSDLPPFARDICELLDHMQVPPPVKHELLLYDFAKAKAHIVASVSGVFEGPEQYKKYGHTRLADVVQNITGFNLDPKSYPKVEMQTSSLGSLSVYYLNELYKSFCGIPAYLNGKMSAPIVKKNEIPPIDIIYPSRDTVHDSRLGPPGAGTICLNTSTWKKPTFPKQVMCDAISQRPGTLMHSKYIIATLPQPVLKDGKNVKGWVYCGSHNATVSAWGKFTVSRESKQPKMNISNWELGVVLPIHEDTDIPAPYLRPAPRYRDSQEAWTQNMEW